MKRIGLAVAAAILPIAASPLAHSFRVRIRDLGIVTGTLPPGPRNVPRADVWSSADSRQRRTRSMATAR